MPPRLKAALPYLALAGIVLGFANFFWFLAESAALGGDALNGFVRDGHYFVASHGVYTEVTQEQWWWSRVHALSIFVTHPLAVLGGGYLLFRLIFPNAMGRPTNIDASFVNAQPVPGPSLATARCGGRIGDLRFSGPFLAVAVYPDCVVIRPLFMAPIVVPYDRVSELSWERGLVTGRVLRIDHAATGVSSPIRLYVSPSSHVVRAIADKAGRPIEQMRDLSRWPFHVDIVGGVAVQGAPDRTRHPVVLLLRAFGIVFGLALLSLGPAFGIGDTDGFSAVWTIVLVGIVAYNAFLLVRDLRRRPRG